MLDTIVVDKPVESETEAILNPVLKDVDLSKANFREQMAKVQDVVETVPDKPETPEPEQLAEKPAKTEEKKPASKVPEELLTDEKPEPKVDEAIAEIDAMVLPKNAKPEQVASFAKLKEQAKRVIEEKAGRIRELETKTSDGATRAEIEAAQERVKTAEERAKELEATVERLAFTESPKFKQFLVDEEAQLAGAKSYLQGTEINPDIIEAAARMSGPARIRILKEAGADSDIISAVTPYLASFDTIQRSKSAALENWKTTSAQYAEDQKAQQEAEQSQRQSEEEKAWSAVLAKSRNDIVPFRKFEKNDDWNARADQLEARAKTVFSGEGVGLDTMAEVIAKGVAYDALDEVRIDLTTQLQLLRKENAKLKAAKPDGGTGQGVNGAKIPETATFEEAAKSRFNQEMAKARGA